VKINGGSTNTIMYVKLKMYIWGRNLLKWWCEDEWKQKNIGKSKGGLPSNYKSGENSKIIRKSK